jgi:hypothetical protein
MIRFDTPDAIIVAHPRSGTHLLQSALSSHPKIHGRGECVLRYARRNKVLESQIPFIWKETFWNKPDHCNLAIVGYAMVDLFEVLCSPIENHKVIHLIRNPSGVARSLARMTAEQTALGSKFKAHYRVNELLPKSPQLPQEEIDRCICKIICDQNKFRSKLNAHSNTLTVTYESLTDDKEISQIPILIASQLLRFLNVEYHDLTTTLRKTGV